MAALRPSGYRGLSEELLNAGDVLLTGDFASTNTTVGATTLAAASMVTGMLERSGSTGAYTDTFDTASNIYNALLGNGYGPALVPGIGFRLKLVNSVAFTETITLGTGMTAGQGIVSSVTASFWREFLFTFTSVQPPVSLIGNTTSGAATITWTLGVGQAALSESPASGSIVQSGASVAGTGIAAGTTVLGVTQGVGGTTGVTLSGTATATGTNVAFSFGPAILVSSPGGGAI